MAYLRDRRAFGNIGTRKFRGARFGDPLSPRGPQYTLEGRVLDYSTDVGPFTIVDQSGESNTATLYSGRGLTMDAVNDTVTYATGYSLGSQTATVWMRVDTLGTRALGSTAGGGFLFTPTATGVWEELTYTRSNVEGDLLWLAGSDCDIGDLVVGAEHWTHNDWSDPTGDTSNGKTIVDSGPNQLHGTCTGCSGFTGEGIDPDVAGIVGLDDAQWFNGVDTEVSLGLLASLSNKTFSVTFLWDSTANSRLLNLCVDVNTQICITLNCTKNGTSALVVSDNSGSNKIGLDAVSFKDGEQVTLTATMGTYATWIGGSIEGIPLVAGIDADGRSGNGLDSTLGIHDGLASAFYKGAITAFNFNDEIAYTGQGATPWLDTIGSNDGTPSGTFVSVGQKRATIPQTADKNWNKYVGLGAAEQGAAGYSTFTPVPYGFDGTLASGVGIAGFTLPATAQIGDSFKICVDITSDQSPSCQFRPTAGSASVVSDSVILSVGHNEITLTLTAAGNFVSVSEGDTPSTIAVRNFTAELISGTAQESVMVSATDANDQIDALGTAISEPRLNTQQLNLFGEGEYSPTPDSASLDVTTTATWEIWGNFYGATATTVAYISKYNAPAGVRSWNIVKSGSALDDRIKMQFGSGIGGAFSGSSEIIVTDAMACITFVFGAGSLLAYIDGLAVSTTESGAIPASLPVTSQDIYIGKENEAATTHVDTKIGSAKIYNTALTAAEVLTNYNTQKSLYGL